MKNILLYNLKIDLSIFKILLFFLIFIPFDCFAYDGYATKARGKYFYQGLPSIYNTDWYTLNNNSFNNHTLSFPSGYTYFINGAEYVAAINFNGEQSFTGSVQIPVVVRADGGVNYPSLISQSNFHIGISSNFGDYNLSPNITKFDKACNTAIQQSQTPIIYTYCTYFVEFNFVSQSKLNGSYNFNFGLYGNSPSQTILSTQDNVFSVSYPLNVWDSSLGLNPNYYLSDNSTGGGNSSTDLTNVENKLDDINNKLNDMNTNQQNTTNAIDNMNDNIMDDNVDDSVDTTQNFFDDFKENSHGLSGIITAPLRLINSLSSSSCSPLSFPLPFVNKQVTLPCMSTIYSSYFNSFLTIYRIITDGLIGYWVCINLLRIIKGLQNPSSDKIEVLDL